MQPVGSPYVCRCPRKLSTSYYGGCWPDLAPGLGDCCPICALMGDVVTVVVRRSIADRWPVICIERVGHSSLTAPLSPRERRTVFAGRARRRGASRSLFSRWRLGNCACRPG